jgi:hypothetical protein
MTWWSYSSLVGQGLNSLTFPVVDGGQLHLIDVATDLHLASSPGIRVELLQLGLMCPSMLHFQHSPDVMGAVPGESGYSRVSFTCCLVYCMFHCVIWVLYEAQLAGVFGWIGWASHKTSFMCSAGLQFCLCASWFGIWYVVHAGG